MSKAHSSGSSRSLPFEVIAFLAVKACWFISFGLQFVLIPYIILRYLDLDSRALGITQTAITGPFLLLLLASGLLAEKYDKKLILNRFYLLAALPPFILSVCLIYDFANLPVMLVYGLSLGTIGALILPARDALINDVAQRAHAHNAHISIQTLSIWTALIQFAATILGIAIGRMAENFGAHYLTLLQGIILLLGGFFSFFLSRETNSQQITPDKPDKAKRNIRLALSDFTKEHWRSLKTVRENEIALVMVVIMVAVGVFIIGASFLVLLPYFLGGDPGAMSNIFLAYWLGAFIATAGLTLHSTMQGPMKRSGRALMISQVLGVACMAVMIWPISGTGLVALSFCWGLASGVSIAMSRAIIQEAAHDENLTRILAVYQLGFMGGAPIGALIAGFLANWVGPNIAVIFPFTGMVLCFVWMGLFTPIWQLTSAHASLFIGEKEDEDARSIFPE